MGQASAFPQRQRLCGRLEGAWYGFIVNGAAARLWGRRGKREVADGDALEVAQLAILVHIVSVERDRRMAVKDVRMAAATGAHVVET